MRPDRREGYINYLYLFNSCYIYVIGVWSTLLQSEYPAPTDEFGVPYTVRCTLLQPRSLGHPTPFGVPSGNPTCPSVNCNCAESLRQADSTKRQHEEIFMTLQDTTKKIVALVEERTGIPVITTPDPSQGTLAIVKIARHSAPAHIVTYNPRLGSGVDYGICFQCGLVLRAYAPTEASRFDFGGTWRGRRETEKLVNEHLRASFNKEAREKLTDQFFDGLMLQLRSIAVGLRVDGWLLQEFPELGEQQRAINDQQLKDNLRILSPEVRRIVPGKIITASLGMNAALAAFWSKSWSEPVLVAPYREIGSPAVTNDVLSHVPG